MPVINSIIDILVDNKGEALDKRIEELLKKEYPYINSFNLDLKAGTSIFNIGFEQEIKK